MPQKLLVLEPNSRMLEVIHNGVADIVDMRHAGAAGEVRRILDAWPADLILAEFRLADGTGLELLENLRPLGEAAPPVVMIASRADAVDRLGQHVALFEEIIQKPFFASELRERIKRALGRTSLRRASGTPDAGPLRGRLEDLSVVDLLQALDLSRKSCAVTVSGRAVGVANAVHQAAVLFLVEGQVKDAQLANRRGDEVVFDVLGWGEGEFAIDFSRRSEEVTVKNSTQGLLMEGLRRLDETNFRR